MSELTKEHFDQQIGQLATKVDLQEVSETQETHTETLESHTSALDGIAKNTEKWNTECRRYQSHTGAL